MSMQVSFLSTPCVIAALVLDVRVKQYSSKRIPQNHSHNSLVGTISSEFSKWVTMQFRYLGEITIQPVSILGIIYETFASVPAVFKGRTKEKYFTYQTNDGVRCIKLFRTESGGSSSNAYEINWERRETYIVAVLLLWERPETSTMFACFMRFAEASTFALRAGHFSRRCKTKAPAILAYDVGTGDASSFTTRTRYTTLGMVG